MHLRCAARRATACFALLVAGPAGVAEAAYDEPFRPQVHFTPAANWMNDPNGLVHYAGEYHLFFQHNPFGAQWGNMSWGHAVSRDLVQWEHLPVALPADADEAVFSGSVVVDHANTSGLGSGATPPMVAVYTSARPGVQAQSLAYSTDRGRTWTKYAGNPVLDIGSSEFRDPKVFWYAPDRRWIMAVALAAERKVALYSSPNLIEWEKRSEFGPANAVGGAWECPDLFPLALDGDPAKRKWVLVVSLSPGSIAGGSGTQYFVGDFDGERFVADDAGPYTPPAGDVLADFEDGTYGAWTATGTAFGDAPATGTLPGQQTVAGFAGAGLVNSFHGGDATTGTLTSPPFTLTRDHVNLLVGGGPHADTAVRLVVDGDVVRSASGAARIEIADGHTGGWGHILADRIMLADAPARSALQRSAWLDHGRDYYAAVSWNDAPDGRRLMIGWMSNWQYASELPTAPWRGAMSVAREVALRTIAGRPRLVQAPIVARARTARVRAARRDGALVARGQALELDATFRTGSGGAYGLRVLAGDGEGTVIGYDEAARELFVDRTGSGTTAFSAAFPSVERAPLAPRRGRVRIRVVVDRSSVEVFGDRGQVAITDLVFPRASSDRVELYRAGGGTVPVESVRAWRLRSAWSTAR